MPKSCGYREHGAGAEQLHVDRCGQGAGDDQRDERARLEFKQQKFDGENDARRSAC